MKTISCLLPLLLFSFCLSMPSCTFLAKQVGQEQDARIASKLPDPQVANFKYADLKVLKKLLEEQADKYQVGLAYLRKAANLYEGKEGIAHDKSVINTERQLNLFEARLKTLTSLYPDQWEEEKVELARALDELRELYKKAFDRLV